MSTLGIVPTDTVPADGGVQHCVVCGQGSHRNDWVNQKTVGDETYVACDKHDAETFNTAIELAEKGNMHGVMASSQMPQIPGGTPSASVGSAVPPPLKNPQQGTPGVPAGPGKTLSELENQAQPAGSNTKNANPTPTPVTSPSNETQSPNPSQTSPSTPGSTPVEGKPSPVQPQQPVPKPAPAPQKPTPNTNPTPGPQVKTTTPEGSKPVDPTK